MEKHLRSWMLIIVGLSVLLGAYFGAVGQTQPQDPSTITPEKRHETHGKLFSVYWRETIPQLLSSRTGDLHLEDNKSPGYSGEPLNAPPYPPYPLIAFACTSDAVIIATAQTGVSHLTSDQKFVYTDWTFTVEQVLKDNLKSRLGIGAATLVTRPGGILEINNRKVFATDRNFRDFQAGSTYLLFLEFIHQTGAYKATAEKSFLMNGKQEILLMPKNP